MTAQVGAPLTVRVQAGERMPVAGAKVTVGESTLTTGAAGEVVFRSLPVGVHSVAVAADGYFANQARAVDLTAGVPTVVSVDLQRAAVIEESVVVTGTGAEYLVHESPVRTELITKNIVDRQVKTTLAEAFQAAISGVRMETNCQNCGFMQIRMNGLEGPYTQILEDGLPTYSGVTAVYGLEQIPTAFVDQIEVVKGGNSALYGPGAVAGVVNLIRREPRENRFRVDAMGGWHYGRPEQQIGAAAQLVELPGEFAADLYYRSANRVPVDRDRDGFSDLGKRRLDSGGFGLFRRFLDGKARLSVNGAVASEFRRGGDQLHRAPHQTWITEQVDSQRQSIAFGWNHAISPNTFYNLRASHAYFGRKTYYGAGMDPNAYGDTRNPVWVGDAQVGHQAGRHSLLAGYQVWWEHVEDNAPSYQRTYGGTFQNRGMYLQDEWRANQRLTLIGGARLDKSNQVDGLIVSPRFGVKYGVTPSLVWRSTISTGFRAPAVFEEDLHIAQVAGEGFVFQNHPGLKEERSLTAMNGLDYAGSWNGRRFQLGASYFHTTLRGAFTLTEDVVPDHSFRRLLRVNGPGAVVSGGDFDGSMQVSSRFGVRGGFTVQTARWREPEPQFGATQFFRTPRRYGFAGFDQTLPGKVEVSGTAEFTGSMLAPHYAGFIPADRLETTPRFLVFNAVIARTFDVSEHGKMRLFFNVQNIGDSYQRDLDRGPNRDSGYVYGPSEMRRAVAGLTFEF